MKFQNLLFAGFCIVIGQAQGALFSDDEAHNQIRQLGERLNTLESTGKQQVETIKQQFQLFNELQTQIDAQNAEFQKLHGLSEGLDHRLQNTEKRQTNIYRI